MLGDLSIAQADLAANTKAETFHARVIIRTDEKLLSGYATPLGDKTFMVIGSYNFQAEYQPRSDQPRFQGKPFLFSFPPEVNLRHRYADWADFCAECEREPQLRWLKKWSYVDEKFFEMIKNNKGLKFAIPFKLVEYYEHLRNLYREQFGVDPGDRGLLCLPYEGEASAAADEEYKKRLYEDSIKRKVIQEKERRQNK